ncbi:MAG: isoprenoid biosynthesis glyoxalase ElbB [Candidatus Fermentibacteraceae bacterium]|nr:isoprenoid biosynthesis glyoxalase ElbB [Candidatus Fermentibacteraceae bacterium]
MPRAAVLLSGCGNRDGSEIHESVCAVIALDRKGWDIVYTAPAIPQQKTVSYIDGTKLPPRNTLEESARIARGKIVPLNEIHLENIDSVVIPGGLGVALTLCDFAVNGASCSINPEVNSFLKNANELGIPIGAMCIAPTLVARCLPGTTLTIGNDRTTADKIEKMGCRHVECSADKSVVDRQNRVVSTPAYMTATGPAQVLEGAISMVTALEELLKNQRG